MTAPDAALVEDRWRTQYDELRAREPEVRDDAYDSVHKMRVATRRLRSALTTYGPLVDRDRARSLRSALKWLAGVLGQARDAEVVRDALMQTVDDVPGVGGEAIRARIDATLGGQYRSAHDEVIRTFDGPRYARLLQDLATFVDDPPWTERATDRTAVRDRTSRDWHRLGAHAARAAAARGTNRYDPLLHETRKAAKRARYAGETLLPGYPQAAAYVDAIKAIQETLGDHQDAVVAQALVADLAADAGRAGEDVTPYDRLRDHYVDRARRSAAEFEAAWEAARIQDPAEWVAAGTPG